MKVALGTRNGFRLRIYGFTDLPPSLPPSPADPFTRITESKRGRKKIHFHTCGGVPWVGVRRGHLAADEGDEKALDGPRCE